MALPLHLALASGCGNRDGAELASVDASSVFSVADAAPTVDATTGAADAAPPVCGDGFKAAVEKCDDGNLSNFDGCTSACVIEAPCPLIEETNRAMDPTTGHCFRAFRTVFTNFENASNHCETAGGHLATISSQAEFEVAASAAVSYLCWIGLTDESQDGTFTWITGDPLGGFAPWKSNEPNNGNDDEDCVEMWGMNPSAGWNDLWCGDRRCPLCEIEPGNP